MIRTATCTAIAATALSLLASSAFAHASVDPKQAEPGATQRIVLRVPHGCNGEATHTVKVHIPEGFHSVKPMPHAGWTLNTTRAAYGQTYEAHGKQVLEGVTEIVWSGGDLPDDWYDEFVFRGTFSDKLMSGQKFFFPTVQVCANGTEEWTNITDDKDAGKPAPSLTLMAASAGMNHGANGMGSGMGSGMHHNSGAMGMNHDAMNHDAMAMAGHADAMQGMAAAGNAVTIGDLELTGAFTRAMAPNAKSGGGFVTIVNKGEEADRLIDARSAAAGMVQLHEMAMSNDVMTMRHLENGIEIPAGESVTLAPGGLHIMFMQVKAPFIEGTSVPVTLTFEKAGEVEIMLEVGGMSARAPANASQ